MNRATKNRRRSLSKASLGICLLALLAPVPGIASPQDQTAAVDAVQKSTSSPEIQEKAIPEVASHEETTTFKVNVRLVLARVVVRDQQGHAVSGLRKEDFQIFDSRKPQLISQFSAEQPGTEIAREQKTQVENVENIAPHPVHIAERFIAYLFDDIHLRNEDLFPVRKAVERRLNSLEPSDRAGIFTISGQRSLDFTDDRLKLREALFNVQPHPLAPNDIHRCPYMSYYMADLIVNKGDLEALDNATRDAFQCSGQQASASAVKVTTGGALGFARSLAESEASAVLSQGDAEVHLTLGSIKDVIRKMSVTPGQRMVVLISPGFLTPLLDAEVGEVIDEALRSNTVVSAIDARGLFVVGNDLAAENVPNLATSPREVLYETDAASANDLVLGTLAESSGGTFIHNSNDLEGGLKQAAETPEYYYVLGFAPQNMKYDGRFHSLDVRLKNPGKYTIEARRGYYAPRHAPNAEEEAKQEIEEAIFSQEEMHGLPIDLHTQFFKPSELDAKLSVLVHVDVKRLHFHKTLGRNNNDLTIAAALFDRNGRFVIGNEKVLEMRLKDETLERRMQSGVTLKTSFAVRPGSYLVRLVVRDSEGLLSAENGAVEIP